VPRPLGGHTDTSDAIRTVGSRFGPEDELGVRADRDRLRTAAPGFRRPFSEWPRNAYRLR